MKIKRGNPDSNYTVAINNYANHRLFNNSTYRTGVDTQLYRTQPDKNGDITITLSPDGEFYVDLQQLNGENYDTLKKVHDNANFDTSYHDIKMVYKSNSVTMSGVVLNKHSLSKRNASVC